MDSVGKIRYIELYCIYVRQNKKKKMQFGRFVALAVGARCHYGLF